MLTGVYTVCVMISCLMTVVVARRLSFAGRPFLVQVFHGDRVTADAVNQLLIVGFCLVNLSLIFLTLQERIQVSDLQTGIELVSCKIGRTISVLDVMHFFNLLMFCQLRDYQTRTVQRNRGGA